MLSNSSIRWIKFIGGGAVNTGFTYLVYICLGYFVNYQLAYFVAYFLGILFSYFFNAKFVFHVSLDWKSFFSYPLAYVVQYFLSAFLLSGIVEFVGVHEYIAPLLICVIMLPITYLMSKLILIRGIK